MRPFMETKIKQRIITLNSGKALLVLGPPESRQNLDHPRGFVFSQASLFSD